MADSSDGQHWKARQGRVGYEAGFNIQLGFHGTEKEGLAIANLTVASYDLSCRSMTHADECDDPKCVVSGVGTLLVCMAPRRPAAVFLADCSVPAVGGKSGCADDT